MRIDLESVQEPLGEIEYDEPVSALQYDDGDRSMFAPALVQFLGADVPRSGQNNDFDRIGGTAVPDRGAASSNMKSGWASMPLYVMVASLFAFCLPVMFPLFLIGIIRIARSRSEKRFENRSENRAQELGEV
ncbi:hypothetical protein BSKO_11923 [Bryopsis sp. KO-2023]|nr:hypothetical protein BSKO_11923 [Bryopsis sp. KO-2023]